LHVTTRLRETRTYTVSNRSDGDREITVEHGVKPEWALLGDAKPVPNTTDLYRFPLKLAKGDSGSQVVVEERTVHAEAPFAAVTEETVKQYLASAAVSPAVKAALTKAQDRKSALAEVQRHLADVQKQ